MQSHEFVAEVIRTELTDFHRGIADEIPVSNRNAIEIWIRLRAAIWEDGQSYEFTSEIEAGGRAAGRLVGRTIIDSNADKVEPANEIICRFSNLTTYKDT